MSEEANPNINLVNLPDLPESIDHAAKNLMDEPTKNIGHTFADLWYLVFGGISHAADKKRIKYAEDLKKYKTELAAKIDAIPAEEKKEPSLQITAQALENSKYCISEPQLRAMFVNLISGSMDNRVSFPVHPSFPEIIKQMSPLDAEIISSFKIKSRQAIANFVLVSSEGSRTLDSYLFFDINVSHSYPYATSISSLERLGLLSVDFNTYLLDDSYEIFSKWGYYEHLKKEYEQPSSGVTLNIRKGVCALTPLGRTFLDVCIP